MFDTIIHFTPSKLHINLWSFMFFNNTHSVSRHTVSRHTVSRHTVPRHTVSPAHCAPAHCVPAHCVPAHCVPKCVPVRLTKWAVCFFRACTSKQFKHTGQNFELPKKKTPVLNQHILENMREVTWCCRTHFIKSNFIFPTPPGVISFPVGKNQTFWMKSVELI